METRPAPDAPPAYVRVVSRVYRRPLRPVVIFVTCISLAWAVTIGTRFLRDMGDAGETSKMKLFDLILGILFYVVAGIEAFGLTAAITQKASLARLYFILSGLAALVTFAAELIRLIAHFIVKKDLIDQCFNAIRGASFESLSGNITTISEQQAKSSCQQDWNRGIWWDIGWLLVSTILAIMFADHQLQDPTFNRTQAPSNAFRMGSWNQQSQDPFHHHDPPFVPPYPGSANVGQTTSPYGYAVNQYNGGGGGHSLGSAPPPDYVNVHGQSPGEGGVYLKEKSDDVKSNQPLHSSDSTITLQPVSLHDERQLSPGEGRI